MGHTCSPNMCIDMAVWLVKASSDASRNQSMSFASDQESWCHGRFPTRCFNPFFVDDVNDSTLDVSLMTVGQLLAVIYHRIENDVYTCQNLKGLKKRVVGPLMDS